jgi:hypothetical protein
MPQGRLPPLSPALGKPRVSPVKISCGVLALGANRIAPVTPDSAPVQHQRRGFFIAPNLGSFLYRTAYASQIMTAKAARLKTTSKVITPRS